AFSRERAMVFRVAGMALITTRPDCGSTTRLASASLASSMVKVCCRPSQKFDDDSVSTWLLFSVRLLLTVRLLTAEPLLPLLLLLLVSLLEVTWPLLTRIPERPSRLTFR